MTRRPRRITDIDAVAFDGYGTVFDFAEPQFIMMMAEILDAQSLVADASDVWKRFLKASLKFRAEHHHEPVYRRYDEAWAMQFEHVFEGLKLSGHAWSAAEYFRARLADAPMYDEVPAVLEALRPHFRLAMLSNADTDFLTAALNRNKLTFEVVLSSEDVGAIKPDPAIFLALAEKLGMEPQRILYVGDNPIPDVLGPSRVGMKSAWVNRGGYRKPRKTPQPDVRVKALAELVPLLVPAVD
jgi:putative hydrolase of the HAD superfamily